MACTQKDSAAGEGIALPLGGGIWPQGRAVFLSVQLGGLKMVEVVSPVLLHPDRSSVVGL